MKTKFILRKSHKWFTSFSVTPFVISFNTGRLFKITFCINQTIDYDTEDVFYRFRIFITLFGRYTLDFKRYEVRSSLDGSVLNEDDFNYGD